MLCFPQIHTGTLTLILLTAVSLNTYGTTHERTATPMLQEALLKTLPRALAEHITNNDQTLQPVDIWPNNSLMTSRNTPQTPLWERNSRMLHQCLASTPPNLIPQEKLSGVFLFLLVAGNNGEHIITGHHNDLSTLFQIQCNKSAHPPLITVFDNSALLTRAPIKQAWLLTIGQPQELSWRPPEKSVLLSLLPRIFMQIRFYLAESRAQIAQKLTGDCQAGRQKLENVLSTLANWKHIPGTSDTKHGYLAEKLEVATRNSQSLATWGGHVASEEPTLNHPVDFYLDNRPIQEKCYRSATASLKAMSKHWHKYGNDSRFERGRYMLPHDQYQQLVKAMSGTKWTTCKEKLEQFLLLTEADRLEDIIIPASVNYKDLHKSNLKSTVAKLREEHQQLYQQSYQQYVKDIIILSFVTGALAGGGFEAFHVLAESYLHPTSHNDDYNNLYRIAGKALYGSLASSGTFLLHIKTGLPAPACGAIINSSLRILHDVGQRAFNPQDDSFINRTYFIAGEELFAGLGASLLDGYFAGQVTGALSGYLLWHWLNTDTPKS